MAEVEVKDAVPASDHDPGVQEPSPEQTIVEEPKDIPEKRGPDGWIPKVRFNEVVDERNSLRATAEREHEERVRLEERLKAQDTARTVAQKKIPTRAELDDMVSRGEITATEANEYMDRITEERAVARALDLADRKAAIERRAVRRNSEMQAYADAAPDIMKRGSEIWNKAAEAYRDIVFYNGEPSSEEQKATYELMAVQTTLGPVSAIKARKDADTMSRANRETYNEVGNSQQTAKTGSDDVKFSKLTPVQQAYFRRMSDAGRYPGGIKEYLEELNYQKPRV